MHFSSNSSSSSSSSNNKSTTNTSGKGGRTIFNIGGSIMSFPIKTKTIKKIKSAGQNRDDVEDQEDLAIVGLRRALAKAIERPLKTNREFFLQNDMFIEFNMLDEENAFVVFKELQRQFRPVQCVQKLKDSKFLAIDFDQTHRGLNSFAQITHQLDSMQDMQMHQLANKIRELDFIIQRYSNLKQKRAEQSARNMEIFKKFKDIEVPMILSKYNPHEMYAYWVFQCVDDVLDSTNVQFGCNESLIKLLGSNMNEYTQLLMRQGWFDLMMYRGRNASTIEYIEILKSLLVSNFNIQGLEISNSIELITFDGVKGTAKISPDVYFCFGEQSDEIFPETKMMIGYMYTFKINLTEQTKQTIIAARRSAQGIIKSDMIYEHPTKSMQHFTYNCEAGVFQDFSHKHSESRIIEPTEEQLLSRTCKIRQIDYRKEMMNGQQQTQTTL